MKGYAERKEFSQKAIEMFNEATALVDALPTPPQADQLRCHELARAVGAMLDLIVVDGRAKVAQHSWLLVPRTFAGYDILDVYTPGRLPMVQLLDCFGALPGVRDYVQGPARTDIDHDRVEALLRWWEGMDPTLVGHNWRRRRTK